MKISPEQQNRLIAAASAAFFRVARWTPLSMGLMGGRLIGAAACSLLSRHRNIAVANLKFAFQNEKSPSEIQRIVYQNFEQWGMITFEWAHSVRLVHAQPGELPFPVRVKGLAHLRAARQKSKAVLLLSAH